MTVQNPLYRRALAIKEKVLGEQHPNTIVVRNNLEYCRAKLDEKRHLIV